MCWFYYSVQIGYCQYCLCKIRTIKRKKAARMIGRPFCLFQKKGVNRVQQHPDGKTAAYREKYAVWHLGAQAAEQRLEQIQKKYAAKSEPNAGIQGDTALKVKGVAGAVPQPAAGDGLHDVAGNQLQYGGQYHHADEHQSRGQIYAAQTNRPPLQRPQTEDEQQSAGAVHHAPGPQQSPRVREAPAVNHHFQKDFIQLSWYKTKNKIQIVFCKPAFSLLHTLLLLPEFIFADRKKSYHKG